jgi:hypothetical protein
LCVVIFGHSPLGNRARAGREGATFALCFFCFEEGVALHDEREGQVGTARGTAGGCRETEMIQTARSPARVLLQSAHADHGKHRNNTDGALEQTLRKHGRREDVGRPQGAARSAGSALHAPKVERVRDVGKDKCEKGKMKRALVKNVQLLMPYLGKCRALLVFGGGDARERERERTRGKPQARCIWP